MLTIGEIGKLINDDINSDKKKFARKGEAYYEGDHDIRHYRLFYYNDAGDLVEDKMRSNVKNAHPFFTELVDQEVQYILSGEKIVYSDDEKLQSTLDGYFNNEDFVSELAEMLTGSISKGSDCMYAYRRKDGITGFQHADSLGIVEVRKYYADDGGEYVIYWYVDRIDKGRKKIKRIQVWDEEKTHFFVQMDGGKIALDVSEKVNPKPHIMYTKDNDENTYFKGFGFIPFFRLDNNKKQFSGLKTIKDLIDDYDLMASSLSNNLVDFDTPIHVVKGFQGDNLDQLQTNIKTKKLIGVDANGGIDVKTVDVPYLARVAKLELDEKNIYRFGMGLNTAGLKDTAATTNIAIKAAYSLLELKCFKLEIRLKQFLRKLVSVVIDEINEKDGTAYDIKDVYFEFKHEVMSNAAENATIKLTEAQAEQTAVNTILNLAEVLDNETIAKEICDILDIDYEKIKSNLPNPDEMNDDLKDAQKVLEGVVVGE